MEEFILDAKTARQARSECKSKWPKQDASYYGYNVEGECVLMSLVRNVTKGNVATASRNRMGKAIKFIAKPV